jgi:hypothetical protein
VRWPAWIAVVIILVLCGTVDYLDRNLKDPQIPALFYGIVLSVIVWRLDRRLRKRRSKVRESANSETAI